MTYHLEPWVTLGANVIIHPFAIVGRLPSRSPSLARRTEEHEWLHIGDDTEICPHAVIYGGVRIGKRCLIGDAANIREGAVIGDGCIIGHRVSVGFDAVLHDNVRVNTGTHVTDGADVGEGTFIGVLVAMASDRRRDVVDYQFTGSNPPIIGKRCLIGSGACLLPGVRVGDGAVVGMGAVVVKDVPDGAVVLGEPARVRLASCAGPRVGTADWPLSAEDEDRMLSHRMERA